MSLEKQLLEGLNKLEAGLPEERERTSIRLLQYIHFLDKWNRVHNLTAVREPEEMITKHVLDSLTLLPVISGTHHADVGAGAGLPGIPLAIARSDWHLTLIESNQKKAAFLKQGCIELALKNIEVICERAECFFPSEKFDTVISRAFADLSTFVKSANHLCAEHSKSRLIAMKGRFPDAELMQLPAQFEVEKVLRVMVPGLRAARHLIVIKPDLGTRD
ncbi:16S rRNA (guanine(527)-N(7))-methyltransferase RsmG [Nitrosomonas sp. Nm34]|uniref:16S rRNA (guanine(527)-N(7))-methyltransferase RsmG n=1 Tax=Nitrosomonas sp. Nm34 TaxID=1881055 RepID=UPI0008F2AD30|nr:16S rRNA (guanine(527)-N(7))-methyltransferase RsmG [Nitrosomonas sp. Nm34]SFI41856.1 16S rRNA (guanine527-N7)-methyltransferase [Nitrosomonas sp. Nm34]